MRQELASVVETKEPEESLGPICSDNYLFKDQNAQEGGLHPTILWSFNCFCGKQTAAPRSHF
jgi:hypothetical protein